MQKLNIKKLFLAIKEISKNNKISDKEINKIIKITIIKSFHSKFDPDANLEVKINKKKHQFKLINNSKLIVLKTKKNIKFDAMEISLKHAKKINANIKIGDYISEKVDFKIYSRTFGQYFKQIFLHEINKLKKNKIYKKYKNKKNTILNGTVITNTIQFTIFKLSKDGTSAFMPKYLKNPKIILNIGMVTPVCIENILKDSKGAQIIVSNNSPLIVKYYLKNEIPELQDNSIKIKGMARIPGVRTKISV